MGLTEKIVLGESAIIPESSSLSLDQMRPPLNSAFPRERLAWEYIDMSYCPSPELLCNDIRVCLQRVNFYGNAPKILALEDVLYPSQNGYGLYNELLLQLRRTGWTIVIIDSGTTTGQKLSSGKLLHNSMITVKPKTKECISILIRDIEDKVKEVYCQLDTEEGILVSKLAPKPTRSTLLSRKLSLDKLVSEVQRRTNWGETGQHIADCLKISLNQVKVLRRFLQKKGLLIKRPYNRKSPNGKIQLPENKPIEPNMSLRAENHDNCPFTQEFLEARAKEVASVYSRESAITSRTVSDLPNGLSPEEGAASDENDDTGKMPPDTPDPELK
ncbi:hypothetical protein SDC9_125109 [bioreactor metagenome]|uniref:Uncharacterized protein n=1 Tax=bioreactor metagenome TaxID=1076179 RepID=A0A645CMG0_9ZZZZ